VGLGFEPINKDLLFWIILKFDFYISSFRSLAINIRPQVAKSDLVDSPETPETSPVASTTATTQENKYEFPQSEERDNMFKSSFAKRVSLTPKSQSERVSLTPQSQSESKSSAEAEGSPQKEVIQYRVSIKLRGNSLPRHEASPEEKTTKYVDIKLTDCSSQEIDNQEEEAMSVPIPVFHFPEPEKDHSNISNNNNINNNGNNNQSIERPSSIFLGPQTSNQSDGPTSPWRSILMTTNSVILCKLKRSIIRTVRVHLQTLISFTITNLKTNKEKTEKFRNANLSLSLKN